MFDNTHVEKYRTRRENNQVIATASFAGKLVNGYAKCHPEDEFSEEFGKQLAAVRCAEKINAKRVRSASRKLAEAKENLEAAQARYEKMMQYLKDADNEAVLISNEKNRLLSTTI